MVDGLLDLWSLHLGAEGARKAGSNIDTLCEHIVFVIIGSSGLLAMAPAGNAIFSRVSFCG